MDNTEPRSVGSMLGHSHVRMALLAVLVLLALFLFAQTVNSFKEFRYIGTSPSYNAITINGEGEVFAVPDIATFSFSVIEEAVSAGDAQDAAARKMESMVSFIKEQGVEEKDVKTIGYSLNPRYEFRERAAISAGGAGISSPIYPPEGERQLVGFEVDQTVEVRVRETSKAGQLIAGVSELGAGSVSGLSFTIDDEDSLKAEARSMAIADAKAKAEVLADELGVRLVRVISYGENDQPIYYGRSFDAAVGFGGAAESTAPAPAVVPTGENQILSRVSVTYEIR